MKRSNYQKSYKSRNFFLKQNKQIIYLILI